MGSLPLIAWPAQAYQFEPAHGFFRRLASENGQVSANTLAELVGVNGRNFRPEDMLSFCRQFPVRNIKLLTTGTPKILGNTVDVNGQVFDSNLDYSDKNPKFCSACLKEKNFYRNWWDLTVIDSCPIHGCYLRNNVNGHTIRWWQPQLGEASAPPQEGRPETTAWESYAMGRMGVVDQAGCVFLDHASLRDVVRASIMFGRSVLTGPHGRPPERIETRARMVKSGFAVLSGGHDAIVEYLTDCATARDALADQDGSRRGVSRTFGWIADAIASSRQTALGEGLIAALRDASYSLRLYNRKGAQAVAQIPNDYLTLGECADRFGIWPDRLKSIAVSMKLIDGNWPRSHCHAFSPDEVKAIGMVIKGAISRHDCARRVGLSLKDFNRVASLRGLKPITRLRGTGLTSDLFMIDEIDAHLTIPEFEVAYDGDVVDFTTYCAMTSEKPAEAASRILAGQVPVIFLSAFRSSFAQIQVPRPLIDLRELRENKRLGPRRASQRPGLSYADAAAILATSPSGIATLVDSGLIEMELGDGCSRGRVTQTSTEQFAKDYAAPRLYADRLDISVRHVLTEFRQANIAMLSGASLTGYAWAHRKSVVDHFGPEWDLNNLPPSADFWRAMRAYWAEERSPNRLFGGAGNVATIKSGRGHVLGVLRTNPGGTVVELRVHADTATPKRLRDLKANLPWLRQNWPASRLLRNDTDGLSMSGSFKIGPNSAAVDRTMRSISQIATSIRLALGSGHPTSTAA